MRLSTAIVSTLVAAGTLNTSLQYAIGQQAENLSLTLPVESSASGPVGEVEPTVETTRTESAPEGAGNDSIDPTPVETDESVAPEAEPTQSTTASAKPNQTAKPTQSSSEPTPVETVTQEPEPEPVAPPAAKTVVSDSIQYKYGVVKISLTATGSDITNVTLLEGDTSYGRDVAYVALAAATVQTDGINYGNVSGATFTTEAFKKAVTNALSKL